MNHAARHFEKVAGEYTDLRDRGLKGVLRRQEQRAVEELATLNPGSRVLDAGCGDGEVLAWLRSREAVAIGVDLVLPMASHCRRRGFEVVVQDMESLGLRPVFDWVLCIGSLEFVADPRRTLAGLAACLRPAGRLVLLFPRRGFAGIAYAAYHRIHGVPIWLFSQREMTEHLAACGLEIEDWRHGALSSVVRARRRDEPIAA